MAKRRTLKATRKIEPRQSKLRKAPEVATLPLADLEEERNQSDVEEEDRGDERIKKEPYDPELIRVDAKTFSLRQIIDNIRDKDLDLAPDFQRAEVWKQDNKVLLIESILLRIPLPAFYFDMDKKGKLSVVDGLQRLSSIYRFVQGEYPLKTEALEYLQKAVGGKYFKDLDPVWQRRIQQTNISVNVIDPQTPAEVKFDIFKRLNRGGAPLTAQEIRHCVSKERSRALLKRLANSPSFLKATNESLKDHPRMADREAVLRFMAFRMAWPKLEDYGPQSTLDEYLNHAVRQLDDQAAVSDKRLAQLEEEFDRAMSNACLIFGEHAFRKWPLINGKVKQINRPLLETWSVALADYHAEVLRSCKQRIVQLARAAMSDDVTYIASISASTSDHLRVKLRFETARKILKEAQK